MHIIGRRGSENQDKIWCVKIVFEMRTIAEHSHKLAWRTLIDNSAIEKEFLKLSFLKD